MVSIDRIVHKYDTCMHRMHGSVTHNVHGDATYLGKCFAVGIIFSPRPELEVRGKVRLGLQE